MVKGITKFAVTVMDALSIRYCLEKALYLATNARQGPVWVEIPLDVQAAEIDPAQLKGYPQFERDEGTYVRRRAIEVLDVFAKAARPLIWVGNGVRLAGAEHEFRTLVAQLGIPVVCSWSGADIMPTADSLCIGRPGIMGDRAGNFAVQNADVILAIGTRLSVPQIGHHPDLFAPEAKLIVVDVDPREASKRAHTPIVADAGQFIGCMREELSKVVLPITDWRVRWQERCLAWKLRYPVMQPEYRDTSNGINSYHFMEVLAKHIDDDAIIVTDVGAGFISAFQSLQLRGSQRLIHSAGVSAMGWGIPGAIGACLAGGGRQVVCLVGDGGAMLNLQELQTIAHHKLPIAIFVFCNNGYMTMQYTQTTHFKREAASSPESGMSCPDFVEIAEVFGIYAGIMTDRQFDSDLDWWLHTRTVCPSLCEVHMPPGQLLVPRVQSRMEDGKFVPAPIEDMWPYLGREEFAAQMGDCEVVA